MKTLGKCFNFQTTVSVMINLPSRVIETHKDVKRRQEKFFGKRNINKTINYSTSE